MYTKSKFFACIAIVLLSMTAIQATFETTPPNQLPTTQPPTLSFPVDNATNVEVSPTFKWNETLTNATIEIYEGNTFNDTPRNNLDLNNYQLVNSHKINNVGEDLSGVAYSPVTNSLYMVNNKKPIAAYITNLIGGETHQIDLIGFDDVEDIVHIDGNKFAVIEETEGLVNYVDITRQIDEIKHSDVALTDQLSGYPIDSNKDGAEGVSFDPENNDIYVVTEDDFKLHRFSIGSTNNSTNDTELTTVNGSSLGLGNLSAIYHLARPSGLDNLAVDGHFLLLSADSEKLVETDLSFTNYGEIDLLDELKPLGLFNSKFEGVTMDNEGTIYIVSEDTRDDDDDPIPNYLYIYKHPGCNLSRVHTQQPIHQASVNGTSYDLPATNPLKHNTEYVWRIVTNEGCSEFSSFTTAPLICTIGDIETTTTCNDNCTPNNPADDTFMITVSATVENGSGFYTVSDGATTSEPIASGDSTTFGPYPTNVTADIQLTFTDSLDSTCTANASVPPASPCSVSLQATVSSSISIDNHDAYEAMDGTMNLINTTIQLGEQINAGGFIFNSGIPQGARILDAKVQFKAGATSAEATTLTISAEKNSSSRDFSMLLNDISNRPMVSERVQWQVIPWNLGERGAAQQTPDISTVIQEIVNRNSFSGNIGIFITGTGNRVVQTHESGTGQAATLTVMYTQCPEAGTTCDDGNPDTENDIENGECCCMGCPYPKGTSCDDGNPNTQNDMYDEYCNCVGIPMDSIHIRIAASEDDVEESGRNGTISAYDDKITIVSYPRKGNQVIGLRFTNINIAPDSKISTAYLRFVAENDNNRAGSLMIYAEDVNNSMPFDRTERRNVSSRNKTSNVKTWTPPDWTGGQTYETKNIAPIIQELIDRDDWEGNDAAITIIIEGTGRRVAKSFDDSPQNAPLLHIKYTSGTEGDDEDIE